MKIVVADDEPDMRDYFAKILPHLGHEVLAISDDGSGLVESCRKTPPDLVITDMKMPHLNGDEALREIWRELPIPAILISAYPCPPWFEKTEGIPAICYLNKPINRAQLQAALHRFETDDTAETSPANK